MGWGNKSLNISSETTGPVKVKFHMESPGDGGTKVSTSPQKPLVQSVRFHLELLWDRGTKVCTNGPGYITKMAAMPFFSGTKKADDLETWYAASGARVVPSLFK